MPLAGTLAPQVSGLSLNFLNTGDIHVPKLYCNGSELTTSETGDGMSVVYNYPNCVGTVTGPGTSEFGHVVAPKALVKVEGGNFSGTMIGNNVYLGSAAEGHIYPYRGDVLLGFYADFNFSKLVNNANPSAIQSYSFVLEELDSPQSTSATADGFWESVQTVKNDRQNVKFNDVHFTKAGTYYFKVYEDQTNQQGVVKDPTKYLVEIKINGTVVDGATQLSVDQDNMKFYKINDEDSLLTITTDEDLEQSIATVNLDACSESALMTWNAPTSDKDNG